LELVELQGYAISGGDLRVGPTTAYESIHRFNRGATMVVIGRNGNRSFVRMGNQVGWIYQPRLAFLSFIRPMARGQITSGFGSRWDGFHRGVDIATSGGREPILAVATGTVHTRCNGWCGSFGNYIVLRHNISGTIYYTLYAHLRYSSTLNVGNIVLQGQQIGVEGSTGNSTGPHLHFEVHRGRFAYSAANALDPALRLNLPNSWSTLMGTSIFTESIPIDNIDRFDNINIQNNDEFEYIDHHIVESWQFISYNSYDVDGNKVLNILEWMTQDEIDLPLTFHANGVASLGEDEGRWLLQDNQIIFYATMNRTAFIYSIVDDMLTLTSLPAPDGSYTVRVFVRTNNEN